MAETVRRSMVWVDEDRPVKWATDSRAFRAYVFQTSLAGKLVEFSGEHAERSTNVRARQWRQLARGTHSVSYRSRYRGAPVIHQITAGTIDIPLRRLRSNWYIPREWGRNLASYKGGALVVDRVDGLKRATLQRERMVLGTPWYAAGAPDLDMSKYELVEYRPDGLKISWVVSRSANRSVLVDIGFLRFQSIISDGRQQTLVTFDSVHRIDPGWLGALTPGLVEKNLRQAFVDHVSKYRRIAARISSRAPRRSSNAMGRSAAGN